MHKGHVVFGLLLAVNASEVVADVCDYKPSAWVGAEATAVATTGTASVATVGATGTALGFYTLTHATSGLTMLGSTLPGASAAGTVGIIGGTGGVVGTVAGVFLSPFVIIAAGVTAASLSAYEGACLFAVDRVEDYGKVLQIVQNLADQADPEYFSMTTTADGKAAVRVRDGDDVAIYPVESLYIADGILKSHDWFFNSTIGAVSWVELVETNQ